MAEPSYGRCNCGTRRRGFVNGVVVALEAAESHFLEAERSAARRGLLQGLDPRIKVAATLALVVGATATTSLAVLALLFGLAVGLAALSGIGPARLSRTVWLGVLLFTGAVVLPAVFLVPGDPIARLPLVGWTMTLQGLRSAAFVLGRAETAATLAFLLVSTTPWPHVLKALASLGVPAPVVAILGMTHRYVFVLLQSALQLVEARRSRIMRSMTASQRRRTLMSVVGVLLERSLALSAEVHMAMIARGYRGEVRLLHDFRARPVDWAFLSAAVAVPVAILALRA